MHDDEINLNWRRLLGVLLVVMALSVVAFAFLGGQTSAILSTVGAALPPPGAGSEHNGGEDTGGGNAGDAGEAGEEPGAGGSDGSAAIA